MKNKNLILAIILLFGILALGFFIVKNITGNIVNEGSKKELGLENNCDCIKKEIMICPEGYKLMDEKRLCERVTEKCFVMRTICSIFPCSFKLFGI